MNELLGITLRRKREHDKLCSLPVTEAALLGRAGREPAPDWPKQRQPTPSRGCPFAINGPSVSEGTPETLSRRVCENLDEALGIRRTAELPIAEHPPETLLPAEA